MKAVHAYSAIAAAALIAGCASTSGVFKVGDNTYQVATRATWELGGRAGASRMALEEATSHCAKEGKEVRVVDSKDSYGHFEGGQVVLKFSCAPKS